MERNSINTLNTLLETQLSLSRDCIYRTCHNKVLDVIEAILRYFNHWQNWVTWQEKFGPERFQSLERKVIDWCNFIWMWLNPIDLVSAMHISLLQLSLSIWFNVQLQGVPIHFHWKQNPSFHLLLFRMSTLWEHLQV